MGVSQAVCCLNDHRSPLRSVEQTSGTESSEGFVRLRNVEELGLGLK